MMDRNRDKWNQICMYDLLLKLQKGFDNNKCVMESLLQQPPQKPCNHHCEECIMHYMNERK